MTSYDERYTDDSHGMAEPLSVLPPPLPPRLEIDNGVEAADPFAALRAAIDREDAPTTEAEFAAYRIEQDNELTALLQNIEYGKEELVRFSSTAANVITRLCVSAAKDSVVRAALDDALMLAPKGYLVLCNRLDHEPSDFFELLAAYRLMRMNGALGYQTPGSPHLPG